MEWVILPLLPSRSESLHFGWYSFRIPLRVGGWVGLGSCVLTCCNCLQFFSSYRPTPSLVSGERRPLHTPIYWFGSNNASQYTSDMYVKTSGYSNDSTRPHCHQIGHCTWEHPRPLTRFLEPAWVHIQNGTSIGSVILQGSPMCPTDMHRQTDKHTDRQTTIHL